MSAKFFNAGAATYNSAMYIADHAVIAAEVTHECASSFADGFAHARAMRLKQMAIDTRAAKPKAKAKSKPAKKRSAR